MGFRDLAASHVSAVFLQSGHFAEAWTHADPTVEADPDADPVMGVLEEFAPMASTSTQKGDRATRMGKLHLSSDVVVSVKPQKQSQFTRENGEVWIATGQAVEDGLRIVQVVLQDLITLKAGYPGNGP